MIHGKQQFHAALFCFRQKLPGKFYSIGFHQRSARLTFAPGLQEGVGHAAADNIKPAPRWSSDSDTAILSLTFRSAKYGDKRLFGMLKGLAEVIEFLLH